MKLLSLAGLLLLAAGAVAGAQGVVRLDSAAKLPGARYGTWSAATGSTTFMGTWTAVPDAANGTVQGTWTLGDAQGKTVAFGGWSAAKEKDKWNGAWRANVSGGSGEYSGTFTSSVDLTGTTQFGDLFEKAARTIVSGTWARGAQSGAWSIRAAAKTG